MVRVAQASRVGPKSSLAFSDWVHMIAPLVEDMSTTSSEYWALLKRETEEWYRTYLVSDPMARLQLQPLASAQLLSSKWSRLSKRLEALLITASPKGVREELIQGRVKSPLHLLCRLHVLYAPGGVHEREHSLRNLQSPGVVGNAQAALESLRQWRRWLSRTESLGGSLPDPVILVKALLTIVKTVLEGNAEVQFRVGLVKAALKPSLEVVHQLHAALLSEVEVLARTQTLKPRAQTSAAAVSAGENPPGGGKGASKGEGQSSKSQDPAIPVPQGACRFYVQGIGCNRGDKCRNAHNWQDIPPKEKKSRCMSCGGVGHQRAACPHVPFLAKPAPPAPPRKPEKPERAEKPKAAAVAATLRFRPSWRMRRRCSRLSKVQGLQVKVPRGLRPLRRRPLPMHHRRSKALLSLCPPCRVTWTLSARPFPR